MVESYTVLPLSPIRRVIAARMSDANSSIPHYRLSVDIELDACLYLLEKLQLRYPDSRLSINDVLIKACAIVLTEVPVVNVHWVDNSIHQFRAAHIAVVVALNAGGMAAPVIRYADSKTIIEISREVKELSARAKSNTLKMNEITGGSFSISNLGMYGIDQFDAIINAPQCAMLAVGSAKPRHVVTVDRRINIATVMRLTLSLDHRAIDGASGALFMSALRNRLEKPGNWAAVEGG
jgi:pyruvate dehydrogenase E2 component (dihydrolipoamide acetyltransferase)